MISVEVLIVVTVLVVVDLIHMYSAHRTALPISQLFRAPNATSLLQAKGGRRAGEYLRVKTTSRGPVSAAVVSFACASSAGKQPANMMLSAASTTPPLTGRRPQKEQLWVPVPSLCPKVFVLFDLSPRCGSTGPCEQERASLREDLRRPNGRPHSSRSGCLPDKWLLKLQREGSELRDEKQAG